MGMRSLRDRVSCGQSAEPRSSTEMKDHPARPVSPGVVWHHATVTRERREKLQGHRGAVLWFTGLPSSGKSTIAHDVEEQLHQMRCRTLVLDGDNVRHGLCGDLGFTDTD